MLIEGWGGRDPRMIPDAKMNAYQKPPKTLPRSVGHFIFLALLLFGHLYLHYLWHKRLQNILSHFLNSLSVSIIATIFSTGTSA